MKENIIDTILDDTEKLAIQIFIDNPKQYEAVKKVLLWEIYQNGVIKKGEPVNLLRNSFMRVAMTMDDPLKMGQRIMAMAEGINFLEMGFKQLSKYGRKEEIKNNNENQAR